MNICCFGLVKDFLLVIKGDICSLQVRNTQGVEGDLPALCCLIPGPDCDTMMQAQRSVFIFQIYSFYENLLYNYEGAVINYREGGSYTMGKYWILNLLSHAPTPAPQYSVCVPPTAWLKLQKLFLPPYPICIGVTPPPSCCVAPLPT